MCRGSTVFYDWVYINALHRQSSLSDQIVHYKSFTDIEFNPKKQLNCQAYSAALYISLNKSNLIDQALKSPEDFLDLVRSKRNRI